MKRFKRLSFVLSIALFAGVITFSACKKDENSEDIGVKAASQYCNCMTELENIEDLDEEDMAGAECALDFYKKYGKYFNIDLDSELEIENIEDLNKLFTDADFGKAFMAELLKCQLGLYTE